MPSVTVYYQKCPECGQTWSAQLSHAAVIRIGKEVFVCKCGTAWPTGRIEWINLAPQRRRAYFLSEAELGVLAICTLVSPLFGYFIGSWRTALKAAGWGFLIGVGFVLVLWGMKLCIVGVSRFRTGHLVSTPASHPLTPAFENHSPVSSDIAKRPLAGGIPSGSAAPPLNPGILGAVGANALLYASVIFGFGIAMLLTFPLMNDEDYWLWGTGILGTAFSATLYFVLSRKVEKRMK